jgi:lipoyl(octanoyl) transferase
VGIRVRRGASYHGLAVNVSLDLEPFGRINPCGYQGLANDSIFGPWSVGAAADALEPHLLRALGMLWSRILRFPRALGFVVAP